MDNSLAEQEKPNFCSRCGRAIVVRDARFCKECGAALIAPLSDPGAWNPAAAFLMSAIPGLGHWYKGQRKRGVIWLITVAFFYSVAPQLGAILHFICAVNAAFGNATGDSFRRSRRHNRGNGPGMSFAAPAPH